jgi:hypothetical protein
MVGKMRKNRNQDGFPVRNSLEAETTVLCEQAMKLSGGTMIRLRIMTREGGQEHQNGGSTVAKGWSPFEVDDSSCTLIFHSKLLGGGLLFWYEADF